MDCITIINLNTAFGLLSSVQHRHTVSAKLVLMPSFLVQFAYPAYTGLQFLLLLQEKWPQRDPKPCWASSRAKEDIGCYLLSNILTQATI